LYVHAQLCNVGNGFRLLVYSINKFCEHAYAPIKYGSLIIELVLLLSWSYNRCGLLIE